MTEIRECPRCGSKLPADAPEGICPRCVLGLGFDNPLPPHEATRPPADGNGPAATASHSASSARPGPTSVFTPTGRFSPPDPAELARHFLHLEIHELLGQGGMGAVYKARHRRLDRLVALKILPSEISADPAFAERFTREARALASLNHPHIVTLYDFGEAGGLYYLLMEFVDGLNLRRMIAGGKLEPREALAIVPQVCDALQYAHDEGIVHRDIKPENILLDKKGRVKIADFGLAKLMNRGDKLAGRAEFTLTGSQQVMGTPHYMAPEQMEHPLGVDHRADIFSLGVVFYEMLTGELPLGRFAAPSYKAKIDVRLDEIVLRSLEKEPERRYQHASAVKTDVERISSTDQKPLGTGEFVGSDLEFGYAPPIPPRLNLPAIALGGVGFVGVLLALFAVFVAFRIWAEGDRLSLLSVWVLIIACTLPISLMIMLGGVAMARPGRHALGRVASILAILPVHTVWLLGLPAGIWALVALAQTDEKPLVQGRATPLLLKALGWAAALVLIVGVFATVMIGVYQSQSSRPMPPSPDAPATPAPVPAPYDGPPTTYTQPRNWKIGPSGPELTDEFARLVLALEPRQIVQVNKILQLTHAESAALEARNTDRQTNSSGHTVFTIKPYPGPIAKLEDRLWSQLDGILSPKQQSLARYNLHLDPHVPNLSRGWLATADLVRSSLFGWGKGGARVEVWRVGTWYHWNVQANVVPDTGVSPGVNTLQVNDSDSAPQPPDEYRRFWNAPPNAEAKQR
jgi:tRNA A-37 threonylcarbamoyl transferase component Bud32